MNTNKTDVAIGYLQDLRAQMVRVASKRRESEDAANAAEKAYKALQEEARKLKAKFEAGRCVAGIDVDALMEEDISVVDGMIDEPDEGEEDEEASVSPVVAKKIISAELKAEIDAAIARRLTDDMKAEGWVFVGYSGEDVTGGDKWLQHNMPSIFGNGDEYHHSKWYNFWSAEDIGVRIIAVKPPEGYELRDGLVQKVEPDELNDLTPHEGEEQSGDIGSQEATEASQDVPETQVGFDAESQESVSAFVSAFSEPDQPVPASPPEGYELVDAEGGKVVRKIDVTNTTSTEAEAMHEFKAGDVVETLSGEKRTVKNYWPETDEDTESFDLIGEDGTTYWDVSPDALAIRSAQPVSTETMQEEAESVQAITEAVANLGLSEEPVENQPRYLATHGSVPPRIKIDDTTGIVTRDGVEEKPEEPVKPSQWWTPNT